MAKIWLFWLQRCQFQYLKCQFIIMEIRLKFRSTGHLTLSNMSKLIPHCSNRWKIVFWAWWGSNFIEMKNFKKQKSFILWSEPMVKWFLAKSKFCKLSPPPIYNAMEPSFPPTSWISLIQGRGWGSGTEPKTHQLPTISEIHGSSLHIPTLVPIHPDIAVSYLWFK